MYLNIENPFGTDAFAAPAPDQIRLPKQIRRKRQLPPAPSLKNLAVKLITL